MINQFVAENTQANLNFNIELQKDKRVYCFIGENGVGKTQLLESMAKSFLYCHSLLNNKENYHKSLYVKDGISEKLNGKKLYLPLGIKINENIVKNKDIDKWGVGTFEHLIPKEKNLVFNNPIVFIGAKNRGYAKNIDKNNIKILGSKLDRFLNSFTRTYEQMNSLEINETSIVDWFVSRLIINPNFVIGQNNASDEVVIICKLLQELEPIKMKDLIMQNETGGYSINMGFSEGKLLFSGIPFEKLSTGYISIIKIFQDIVDGFSSWRLNEAEDISQMEGVVFIDEIEAHLHPKWEQSIIPFLKKHFPKTTFYIATHSPLIISTTEEGEAYELVKEGQNIEARELGNPKAWYLADIYSDAFHIEYNNEFEKEQEEILKLMANYSKLVKEYTKDKNESLKIEIENLYDKLNGIMAQNDPRRKAIENLKALVV